MTRYFQNSLAAFAAIAIFAASFGAVVDVPSVPAFAAGSVATSALA